MTAPCRPPTVGRSPRPRSPACPLYLRSLHEEQHAGGATISSERLAELAGVNAAKVRKDLSYLGSYGTRGVGYDVEYLVFQMSRELGLTQDWPVVIVGVGNLGQALANYGAFGDRGFPIVALCDADQRVIGTTVHGVVVRSVDDLPDIAEEQRCRSGSSPRRRWPPRPWPTSWSWPGSRRSSTSPRR